MRFRFFYPYLAVSLFFISCSSSSNFMIPGAKTIQDDEIANEYLEIGDEYLTLKKYDKAIKFYQKAQKNKRFSESAAYKTGRAYGISGKYEEALAEYEALLQKDENNTALKISVAYLLAMTGKTKEALSIYEDLLESDNADVHTNYVNLLLETGDLEKAEEMLVKIKEKFKGNKDIPALERRLKELEIKRKK